jgi:hypothetical protein
MHGPAAAGPVARRDAESADLYHLRWRQDRWQRDDRLTPVTWRAADGALGIRPARCASTYLYVLVFIR